MTKSYVTYVRYYIIRRKLLHYQAKGVYYIIRRCYYIIRQVLHYQAIITGHKIITLTQDNTSCVSGCGCNIVPSSTIRKLGIL